MKSLVRRILFSLSLVLGFAFAALVLGEAALRLTGYKMRTLSWAWTVKRDSVTSLDRRRIWSLRANRRANYWELKTDANAFRVDLHEVPPSERSCPKIFFVGDSNVFGHGVNGNQTIPFYLQQMLREAGYDVAVVNAGVDGYSPGQEYVALQDSIVPRFRPALVLWGVHFNDTLDMRWRSLHFRSGRRLIRVPGWTNGVYLQGLAQKATPGFLRRSRLWNFLLSSLEYVDPVYWLQRPSNADSAEKIDLMVKDVERQDVPVMVVRMASVWELTDNDPVTVAFYANFAKWFHSYINLNDSIEEWAGHPDRSKPEKVSRMVNVCILPPEKDALRHLTPLGNRICAESIFKYLVDHRMADKFPRIAAAGRGRT